MRMNAISATLASRKMAKLLILEDRNSKNPLLIRPKRVNGMELTRMHVSPVILPYGKKDVFGAKSTNGMKIDVGYVTQT
jgi:hypothetical protein